MDIASLIISVLSLIISVVCVSMMLAKNFFSSHSIQYVDPFKGMTEGFTGKSKDQHSEYAEIGTNVEEEDEIFVRNT